MSGKRMDLSGHRVNGGNRVAANQDSDRIGREKDMLQFPKDYFKDEYREGFLVDTTMKTVWAAELEVLAAIADVCAKYQLPWFADWGTLLGAVRHQGFVPWDDDIDICMLREDYQKLMKVLPRELPEGWHVYGPMCEEPGEQFWACVMNADSISIEEKRLQEFHGCPFIVGVDIFPLDYLPRDSGQAAAQKALFILIWKAVQLAGGKNQTPKDKKELEEALTGIEGFCNVSFDRQGALVPQLWRLGNQLAACYGEADGDYLTCYLPYIKNDHFFFDKRCYDDVEYLPFEEVFLPVPKGWDTILEVEYGDWRTPVRGKASHDYPFYNDQLEQLRKKVREMEEEQEGKEHA